MKKLLIPILIILLSGCSHLYKHYDYEAGRSQAHGGEVTVVLNGGFSVESKSPSITKVGSPYCVVVYWHSKNLALEGNDIETRILSVTQESGLEIRVNATKQGKIKTPNKRFHPDAEDKSYFNAAACDLVIELHEPVTVQGVIVINGVEHEFKARLEPKYWQEHRNDTFDGIMSV